MAPARNLVSVANGIVIFSNHTNYNVTIYRGCVWFIMGLYRYRQHRLRTHLTTDELKSVKLVVRDSSRIMLGWRGQLTSQFHASWVGK